MLQLNSTIFMCILLVAVISIFSAVLLSRTTLEPSSSAITVGNSVDIDEMFQSIDILSNKGRKKEIQRLYKQLESLKANIPASSEQNVSIVEVQTTLLGILHYEHVTHANCFTDINNNEQ